MQGYCQQTPSKEMLEHAILTDVHTLDKYRKNLALANFEPFAQAFNCPVGSPMNPVDKCAVW